MGYKPSHLQEVALGVLTVVLDLGTFKGIGNLWNKTGTGALKAATQYTSDKLVAGGMTRALADQYTKNAFIRLNAMMQSGTVLGVHTGMNDIATKLATGTDLRDIQWDDVLSSSSKSFGLGVGVGAFGVGANYIKNTKGFQKLMDGSVRARLIEQGYGAASFGGEVGVFTVGEILMDEHHSLKDITMKQLINTSAVIAALKVSHVKPNVPKGMFRGAEVEAIRKHTKDYNFKDPIESILNTPGAIEKIMSDKGVPYSVKYKLADLADLDPTMLRVSDVKLVEDSSGVRVETRDANGILVQVEKFATKADAMRFHKDIKSNLDEMSAVEEAAILTCENQMELARRLEKSGVANFST
jgi:hypothetical protein